MTVYEQKLKVLSKCSCVDVSNEFETGHNSFVEASKILLSKIENSVIEELSEKAGAGNYGKNISIKIITSVEYF